MKSNYIINLILITVLAGLYWFINNEPTSNTIVTSLTNISNTSINSITISQANRSDIVLKKTNEQWQLSSPITARANHNRIRLLLSILAMQPYRQQAITVGQDLSQFGIHKDSTSLVLNDHHFIFGDIEPIEQRRYVQHDNDLYLLEDTVSPLLNTSASSFIDNRLIQVQQKISKLTIPQYQQQSLLKQTASLKLNNGQWQSNAKLPADKLVEIIDNWQHAAALRVMPLNTLTDTLQPSPFHAIVQLKEQTEAIKLTLHLSETHFFIVNEQAELAYQFPKASYQTLLIPALDQ